MAKLTAELGLETFPTYNTGEHLLRFGDQQGRYRGTIPRLGPLVLADMGQAQAALRSARGADPARGALGRRPCRGAGRADVRDLDPPQRPHGEGTPAAPAVRRSRVRRRGVGLLAAARALLHALGRGSGHARRRRAAAHNRTVSSAGRSSCRSGSPSSSGDRRTSRRSRAADRAARWTWSRSLGDSRRGHRPARDRRRAAGARGPDRVRPAAPGARATSSRSGCRPGR